MSRLLHQSKVFHAVYQAYTCLIQGRPDSVGRPCFSESLWPANSRSMQYLTSLLRQSLLISVLNHFCYRHPASHREHHLRWTAGIRPHRAQIYLVCHRHVPRGPRLPGADLPATADFLRLAYPKSGRGERHPHQNHLQTNLLIGARADLAARMGTGSSITLGARHSTVPCVLKKLH